MSVARVGKTEFIAIEDVVEESSKVSAPAVPGALLSGTGQEGKKKKVSSEVILSILLLPNSFVN